MFNLQIMSDSWLNSGMSPAACVFPILENYKSQLWTIYDILKY